MPAVSRWSQPVSYTHLDVYKRQALSGVLGSGKLAPQGRPHRRDHMHLYQIFTWKGYEHKDLETIDPLYLNAQGDKGDVMLAVVNPIIELKLSSHFKANMEVSDYYRHTHYSYHEDVRYKVRTNTFFTFGSSRSCLRMDRNSS